jgi:glycosyltransferase involved in cell wall biosynthesis
MPAENRIALAMIVRNAETVLEACLASIRPHVDEVNLYLAGESTDNTIALIEQLAAQDGRRTLICANGRKVPYGPQPIPVRSTQGEWHDDFAEARQRSFEMVSRDIGWILWCDADDVLHGGHHLHNLAARMPANVTHVEIPYKTCHDPDAYTLPKRLVRATVDWRWKRPVYEDLHADDECGMRISERVIHFDHTRTEFDASHLRNLRILRAQVAAGDTTRETATLLKRELIVCAGLDEASAPEHGHR